MISGIFCEVVVPSVMNPEAIKSVNKHLHQIFEKPENLDFNIIKRTERQRMLQAAYDSFRYISSKQGRTFLNRTIDLLRSMGVGIYQNGILVDSRRFSASKAKAEGKVAKKKHPSPESRFDEFLNNIKLHSSSGSVQNKWHVVFVATMPYATRLEVGDKSINLRPRKVLIGNIQSVVNAFFRNFYGREVGKTIPREIFYGYYFERGGGPRFLTKGASSIK